MLKQAINAQTRTDLMFREMADASGTYAAKSDERGFYFSFLSNGDKKWWKGKAAAAGFALTFTGETQFMADDELREYVTIQRKG